MDKSPILGRRIKYFRKRAGKSQMDLELAIGASPGTLSRIESGEVNPLKETILDIAKVLDMGSKEIDYLIGQTVLPATQNEINKAIEEVDDILNKRGKLAYLLDDRWRFCKISNTFLKILKVKPDELDYVIGKTTAHVIADLDSPVIKRVDDKFYKELLSIYLSQYYSEKSYMSDDEIYQQTLNVVTRNSVAKRIWSEIERKKIRKYTKEEDRSIHFNIFGFKEKLYYYGYQLPLQSRFELIEFHTESRVLDFLPKLL